MAKAHVVTWRSIVTEEWLVEGAANAAEAREMFLNGECRLSSKSEFDTGGIRGVRLATEHDIASADLHRSGEPHRSEE
ncbi:hypothetical protein LH464_17325 [Neorhizobium sp. T786]|uniref:hypothetical protein n=1 Tax=Pseudorhizobium xiangyangii TaxID=2883104 RepID=UPI001D0006FC|nr:hypothetical protein [Neorhizobium xiangyangii]MCB5204230.1 hypothetical protein [Neorhizobium xiangyangii]